MPDALIGRKVEQKILLSALETGEAEMVAVYGRRRVGKTFLINWRICLGEVYMHATILA